jgi:selenide,water dikinase
VVLSSFAMQPLPGVRLTVICSDTDTPYSGMLPGYIAGHYDFDEVHIDLRRLAEFAGARYFRDEVVGIDRAQRKVLCRTRPPLPYDRCRSTSARRRRLTRSNGAAEHAIPVKPIRRFNERWLALLERVRRMPGDDDRRRRRRCRRRRADAGDAVSAAQGTGALGRDPDELRFHLFSADTRDSADAQCAVRRAFEQVLAERAVVVHRGAEVVAVAAGSACAPQRRDAGG